MAHHVPDLAAYLRGDWHLTRRLAPDADTMGRARGLARFAPVEDGLAYREEVRLELPGYSGNASRDYFYRLDRRAIADIFFHDGRPFHKLNLRDGACRVTHRCREDLYKGIFRVLNARRWSVRWHIRGPHKNARILTLYHRLPAGDGFSPRQRLT